MAGALAGTALKAGKYGLGLSMLTAVIGSLRGENAGAVDGFAKSTLSTDTLKWFLSFFVDDEQLDDHPLLKMLEGNEDIVNAVLAPMLLLPGKAKLFGILTGIGVFAYKASQGEFPEIFNDSSSGVGSGDKNRLQLTPEGVAELTSNLDFTKINAVIDDIDNPQNVAQVAGTQNVAFTADRTPVDADADPGFNPDKPELANE